MIPSMCLDSQPLPFSHERHPHDQGSLNTHQYNRAFSHRAQLFGWEPKVNDQVAEKREDELTFIKKFKMLELCNGIIK